MRIVLDTNVLVSGLLNPEGNPGRIVDLFLSGDLTLLVDDRIMAEYRSVLTRPKFPFEPQEVADVLAAIEAWSVRISSVPLDVELADEGDIPFLEVAVSGAAEALVTGNVRHYRAGADLTAIVTPAEFVRRVKSKSAPAGD